jgi:hypothetical protein
MQDPRGDRVARGAAGGDVSALSELDQAEQRIVQWEQEFQATAGAEALVVEAERPRTRRSSSCRRRTVARRPPHGGDSTIPPASLVGGSRCVVHFARWMLTVACGQPVVSFPVLKLDCSAVCGGPRYTGAASEVFFSPLETVIDAAFTKCCVVRGASRPLYVGQASRANREKLRAISQ